MRILYVDVDSLRPDHLGCYGYDRDTSPAIDRIGEEGVQFTDCYASDAPCLPSRTALFSGRFGVHTGAVNHGGTNADPRRHGSRREFRYPQEFVSWPTVLRDAGFHTASISPFPSRHDAWHTLEGFEEYHDTGKGGNELAAEILPHADRWLAEHAAEDDWFLHVNFWDPHKPYETPAEYGNPFEDDPMPEWLTDERIAEQRDRYGPHSARAPHGSGEDFGGTWDLSRMPETIEDRGDFGRWIDAYDAGVRYMDDHVGQLFERLEDEGVLEETLIVVSADHGEMLGELNVYGDHQAADAMTCRVPLLVRGPNVEPGVAEGLHYQLDLPPTVVELAGGDPPAGWDGRSFARTLTDGADAGREFLVTSQGAWACQRGVRWDDWLLLRTYHDGYKEALDEVMLFDLHDDPHETTDLADDRPEVVEEGFAKLGRWLDDRLGEAARGERGGNPDAPAALADPLQEVVREDGPYHVRGRLEPFAARLRENGREDAAARLERGHE